MHNYLAVLMVIMEDIHAQKRFWWFFELALFPTITFHTKTGLWIRIDLI
jgi:hypothetical protein